MNTKFGFAASAETETPQENRHPTKTSTETNRIIVVASWFSVFGEPSRVSGRVMTVFSMRRF